MPEFGADSVARAYLQLEVLCSKYCSYTYTHATS